MSVIELVADALPTFLPRTASASQERRGQVQVRGHHRPGHAHVIDDRLFRGALTKERKRAERFDQPFMLGLVSARDSAAIGSVPWVAMVEALRSVAGDTDVIGWFENGTVLGIIVPEIGTDAAARRARYKKLRRDLRQRLEADGLRDRFSVRLHVHSGAAAAAQAEPLPTELHGQSDVMSVRDRFKRGLDVIGSVALLLMLLPVYVVVAALVKLTSPGPVFFRQDRIGQMARPFKMLKFRTMHVNNDPSIHQKYVSEFIKASAGQTDTSTVFKIVNDPRITPIGHILRKTSLDELPQFLNVLNGEMSLVGPRPPLAYEVAQYKPWHYRRVLEAKPGVTGLWQVTGRSRTTFDDMVRLDLRYARTYSVWTDLKILCATPRAVISGKGAC